MPKLFSENKKFKPAIEWAFSLISQNVLEEFVWVNHKQDADLIVGPGESCHIQINPDILEQIYSRIPIVLPKEKLFFIKNGKPDFISTIIYLVNCVQEYQNKYWDHFGRFPYQNSIQNQYNFVQENYVDHLISSLASTLKLTKTSTPSKMYLSHDIDFLNGSIRTDLKWATKKFKWATFLKILWSNVIKRPHWFNIDRIANLESTYDFRSTFFWLVEKGMGPYDIPHADYDMKNSAIQKVIEQTGSRGFDHGLHKSAYKSSIYKELKKFPSQVNRFHFLRFNLPQAWNEISDAGLKADASLGFAEEIGFRNSYGKPFIPFDFHKNDPYSFVEIPLHVMDATLLFRKQIPQDQMVDHVVSFIEKNKENSVISILYHNNFLTDYYYRGAFEGYKKLLLYLYENNFETASTTEIVKEYIQ